MASEIWLTVDSVSLLIRHSNDWLLFEGQGHLVSPMSVHSSPPGTIELSAHDFLARAEKLSLFDETLKQVVLCYSLIYISSFPCFTVTDD